MRVLARRTGAERRTALVEAAIIEFARHGCTVTVEAIARRVGVSQPYVFRLFPGKAELLVAAVDRCFERLHELFDSALEGVERNSADPAVRQGALVAACRAVLAEPVLAAAVVQAFAGSHDDHLRQAVREEFQRLVDVLEAELQLPGSVVRSALADMLLTAMTGLADPSGGGPVVAAVPAPRPAVVGHPVARA